MRCRRVFAFLAAGAVLAGMTACSSGSDDTATTSTERPSTTMEVVTTEPPPSTLIVETTSPATDEGDNTVVMPDWSPALAGVTVAAPPEPASCPDGSQGSLADQVPAPDFFELSTGPIDVTAALDPSTHSIVMVRRGAATVDNNIERETVAGRLDVCTGTWSIMSPDFGELRPGEPDWPIALVYDEDSAALVAFTHSGVRVYDPAADEWVARPDADPADGSMDDASSLALFTVSAVYHPASGMIIAGGGFVAAYDVYTSEWHEVGRSNQVGYNGDFLGIEAELDRFVIVEGIGQAHSTRLVEPATGALTDVSTPAGPWANTLNAFGADEAVGQVDGTVYVSDQDTGTICGFNGQTLAWDLCIVHTLEVNDPGATDALNGSWALAGDPVNNQLIAIPPAGPIQTAPLPDKDATTN